MYSRTRKSEETGEGKGSATKTRLSRLPQRRKISMRSTSEEQQSYTNKVSMSASKRSRSACGTPSKTPIRTNYPYTQGTTEKDRKQISELSHKIVDFLQSIGKFGFDFLSGGLRTMTTKQFVSIISHFMSVLAGSRFTIGATNVEDDIMKFLIQLDYPNALNKSWLKTPTAPHAYSHIIDVLSWLCELMPISNHCLNIDPDEFIDIENELPDKEYIKKFIDVGTNNFSLWNNQMDEEFEECKTKLIDTFIYKRTNISSKEQIQQLYEQTKSEYDELYKNKFVIKNKKKFKTVESKVQLLEATRMKLQDSNEVNKAKHSQQTAILMTKQKQGNNLESIIKNHKEIIQKQPITISDRNELYEKLNYKKNILASQKKVLQQIKDSNFPIQVQFARSVKKQADLQSKLSSYANELGKYLENLKISNITSNDMCIWQGSPSSLLEQLDRIITNVEYIKSENLNRQTYLQLEINEKKIALKLIQSQIDSLSKNEIHLKNESVNLEQQLHSIQAKNMIANNELKDSLCLLSNNLAILKNTFKELEQEKHVKTERCSCLEKENLSIQDYIDEKGYAMIESKKKRLQEMEVMHDEFKSLLSQLKTMLNQK